MGRWITIGAQRPRRSFATHRTVARHIKARASDALIAAGGTIAHHHAVGRDHMPWCGKQRPALFGKALAAAKSVLYPAGIMNPGVMAP